LHRSPVDLALALHCLNLHSTFSITTSLTSALLLTEKNDIVIKEARSINIIFFIGISLLKCKKLKIPELNEEDMPVV